MFRRILLGEKSLRLFVDNRSVAANRFVGASPFLAFRRPRGLLMMILHL